jgi:hypothetical protein
MIQHDTFFIAVVCSLTAIVISVASVTSRSTPGSYLGM